MLLQSRRGRRANMKPLNFADPSPFGNVNGDQNSSKNDRNFISHSLLLIRHRVAHWRSATAAELYCFKPHACKIVLKFNGCFLSVTALLFSPFSTALNIKRQHFLPAQNFRHTVLYLVLLLSYEIRISLVQTVEALV